MQGYIFLGFMLGVYHCCKGGVITPDHACPTGWDVHMTRCYWYLDTQLVTWSVAKQACLDLGGYLYVPSSDDEGVFVQEALEKRTSISEAVWIGCHDKDVEGTYDCIEDTSYRNWAEGEPNNIWEEDCISVYTVRPNDTLWNDKSCDESYNAVCERAGVNLYKISRRFQISSDISGGTARVLSDHCLVEQPYHQLEGFAVNSLLRCAVACAEDSECEAFNFLRHNALSISSSSDSSSLSSSSSRSPGTCQKLLNLTGIIDSVSMTEIEGCSFYELK